MKSAITGVWFSLLLLLTPQEGLLAADEFCLTNQTSSRLYVVLSAGETSPNAARWLPPRGTACETYGGQSARSWKVSVFAGPDAIEGCTEIVPVGTHGEIVHFIEFDRCTFNFQPKP